MMAAGAAMAGPETRRATGEGEGERRERAARRRTWAIKGGLFAAGLAAGAYIGGTHAAHGWAAPWSPLAALLIAGTYLAAMVAGSILLARNIDELERHRQYKVAAAAAGGYALIYPLWFALWKGGFVPEPVHWILFLLFWVILAGAALRYRFG